jgi:hypothetical protein
MPIDSNIALGVRPIEQPNMLAQYGQVMQLRQMQQENESNNALRDFYANGGDISNAEQRRQLMSQAPLLGQKILGQESERRSRDIGTTEKAIKLYKDQVGSVNDSASAASLITAVYNDPLTRPFVESMAPLDKALANIPNDPAKLEQWKRGFGLTADKLFADANTMANNAQSNINNQRTVGASYYSSNVSRDNAANRLKFDESKRTLVPMENGYGVVDPYANVEQLKGYGTFNGPNAPAAPLPPAAASAFVTQPGRAVNPNALNQTPSINALRDQPVNQAGAPTVANAAAVQQQQNVPRPPMTSVQQKERAIVDKLPEAIAMNKSAIQKIDQMIGGIDAKGNPLEGKAGQPHPGLNKATGFGGGAMRFFSGTEGKNFEIRHNEVLSQAFLDAFEALKGGGAITEKEGEKATAARTRMNLAQDKKEYMEAAREYQDVLRRGIATAEQKFQRSGGGTSATPSSVPSTNTVIDFGSLK